MSALQLKDGERTRTVYRLIKDASYGDAIQILNKELKNSPLSRAGLSLLAYCHYQKQDYEVAAEYYNQLAQIHPEVSEYRLYHAQALYKAGSYPDSMHATQTLDSPTMQKKVLKLRAAIKYAEGDFHGVKVILGQLNPHDADTISNQGCMLYKDGCFEEAVEKFTHSVHLSSFSPDLSYNLALCHYQLRHYETAQKHITDIIDKELEMSSATDRFEITSVGKSPPLHATSMVEAVNLKAAIEFQLKNFEAAQMALANIPPRTEKELDAVTLHNQALLGMESNPSEGLQRLNYLLNQTPSPPETFGNLLLLYCRYEYFDLAADILAENAHLTFKNLSQFVYEFLDALITGQTASEEAFQKFENIISALLEQLRKLTHQVQNANQNHDETLTKVIHDYDETLERFVSVLMAQAKIFWDCGDYDGVERLFQRSGSLCSKHDTLRLNVAHVSFMQNKYRKAISFYEPLVKKKYDDLLSVSAVVLANLCVAYIMTGQNEEAEDLMRRLEKEEEQSAFMDPGRKSYHLCIVNLVIGTLYCAKGNFDFGISRMFKSLEPYPKKLSADTWFYVKRCFLSLLANAARHVIALKDDLVEESLLFLTQCEAHGDTIPAYLEPPVNDSSTLTLHPGKNSITYEARLLRFLLLEISGWEE
uniref:Tetratricopeptide repeat protein 30 n=1 Tax=Eptatretus burgeri TaxID=7764 RepID=A0A8C4Q8B6_EPTBU